MLWGIIMWLLVGFFTAAFSVGSVAGLFFLYCLYRGWIPFDCPLKFHHDD